jgi:LysM repeat protein
MNRKLWILFVVMVAVILVLSGASSYLFFKNRSLKNGSSRSAAVTATSETSASPTASPTVSATTKPSSSSDRPSSPSKTHTIAQGETLFTIATKYNLTWTVLAAANGISDADKIKAGQTLIIPEEGKINYTVDAAKVSSIAKSVAAGKSQFRLDPVETAKSDAYPAYSLQTSSTYALQAKDINVGTATVLATAGDLKYTITLTQPDVKGDKGIWAITSITPVK